MKKTLKICLLFLCISLLISCQNDVNNPANNNDTLYQTYSEFPEIKIPADNKLSSYKIELGRMLFYEKLLSRDSTVSCSTCHRQSEAFASKGNAVNPSVGGQTNFRNVPPVFNIGYYDYYFWDGRSQSLEQMFHEDLTALTIFNNDTNELVGRLSSMPEYVRLFKLSFADSAITPYRIAMAISSFVRTITSGNSRYDLYVRGDSTALSVEEKRGMKLFMSERTNCNACHTTPLFTDLKYHSTGINTHYFDFGRFYVTEQNSDRGKFRTPSVRNIELTAPYMHNGEINSLDELIEHYNRGGKLFINKSELIIPLNLTNEEKKDLLAFLKALTDVTLLSSSKYGPKNDR
jgi:cytochrome c peroxidase